ncbi:MAG: hypothetical protein RJQ01_00675 [Microcella sp.]|uniref:hypothetical protein n=1 Tax=Microcella sp. TaxID=1913979 RepID=UPI0033159457
MDGELAGVSDSELKRLAYARASTTEERERAAAAGAELARRTASAAARDGAAQGDAVPDGAVPDGAVPDGAVPDGAGRDAVAEHPDLPQEHPQRRRMRAVGLAGVLAAALALPGVSWALSLPDPDPLAAFGQPGDPATAAFVTELLGPEAASAITVGPQLARLDDGIVAIAFRASTVPDGRSTVWDAYCLFTANDPEVEPEQQDSAWQFAGQCVTPERFEAEGITAARRSVAQGDASQGNASLVDAVVWGPEWSPRIVRDLELDPQQWRGSVTDALAYGGLQPATAPEVDGAERLVMGPAQIASSSGVGGATLTVSAYLIESAVDGVRGLEPQYCLLVSTDEAQTSTACAALPIVERQGLSVRSSTPGENWLVELGTDGSIRFDRF